MTPEELAPAEPFTPNPLYKSGETMIVADWTPMQKHAGSIVYMQQMTGPFDVDTAEGRLSGGAGDFLAYDPASKHLWPVKASYVELHYAAVDIDTLELISDLFTYHAPTPEQAEKYGRINAACKAAALVIHTNCPPSADRSAAIRLLREARMTANASIATKSGGSYR